MNAKTNLWMEQLLILITLSNYFYTKKGSRRVTATGDDGTKLLTAFSSTSSGTKLAAGLSFGS